MTNLFYALWGAVIGILSGILGIGGGILMVPTLSFFLGLESTSGAGDNGCHDGPSNRSFGGVSLLEGRKRNGSYRRIRCNRLFFRRLPWGGYCTGFVRTFSEEAFRRYFNSGWNPDVLFLNHRVRISQWIPLRSSNDRFPFSSMRVSTFSLFRFRNNSFKSFG